MRGAASPSDGGACIVCARGNNVEATDVRRLFATTVGRAGGCPDPFRLWSNGRRHSQSPFRSRRPMEIEILVGRALAMCVHPCATWRSRSTKARMLVLAAYVLGGYAVALGLLFAREAAG